VHSPNSRVPSRSPLEAWGPPLFYLTVALVFLMPLPLGPLRTTVPRTSDDVWLELWWFWWVCHAVTGRSNPLHTNLLFHPFGAPLYLSGMGLLGAAVSIPLQLVMGVVPAFNLVLLAAMVFGAFAMYLLARHVTGSEDGALLAGAVLGFAPLVSESAGHPALEYANIGFLALSILFLLRLRDEGVRAVLFAGLSIGAASLVSLYQALFLVAFTAFYVAAEIGRLLWCRSGSRLPGFIGRLAGSWALAFLLVSPALVPAARLGRASQLSQVPRETIVLNSASALEPFLPNVLNPLLGAGDAHKPCALGYVSLGLAALGVRESRRRSLFWIAMTLVFYGLSLGPVLKAGQHVWELPFLPYNIIRVFPLGRIPRAPIRFLFLTLIAESVLAAWGVVWLQKHAKIAGRRVGRGAAMVASLTLVLFEWLPGPRAVAEARIPSLYSSLANGPPGALLELPSSVVSQAMYWQTAHGRPLVWGYVGRHLEEGLMTEALPVVRQLRMGTPEAWRELTSPDILEQPSPLAQGAEVLDALGIRYVVLHKSDSSGKVPGSDFGLPLFLRQETVVWDDAEIEARLIPPRDARTKGVVLGIGQGWQPVERSPDGSAYRWTAGGASLSLVLLDTEPRTVRIVANAFSYLNPRLVMFKLGSRDLARVRVSDVPARITLLVRLTPGDNVLHLEAEDPPGRASDGRPLSIGFARVRAERNDESD
jgi:hypothetical protein